MLPTTAAALLILLLNYRKVAFCISLFLQTLYLAYLVCAILVPFGYFPINLALLILSFIYLIYFLTTENRRKRDDKKQKKRVKRVFSRLKLAVHGVSLLISIYGIVVAAGEATRLPILFLIFTIVLWVIRLWLDIKISRIEERYEKALESVKNTASKTAEGVKSLAARAVNSTKRNKKERDEKTVVTV